MLQMPLKMVVGYYEYLHAGFHDHFDSKDHPTEPLPLEALRCEL